MAMKSIEKALAGPSAADYKSEDIMGLKQQASDKNSLYNHYKQLIQIKNRYDVITDGTMESLNLNSNVYALRTYDDTDDVIVIHNLSDQKVVIDYDFSNYKIAHQIYNASQTKAVLNDSLELSAYNSIVLIKK